MKIKDLIDVPHHPEPVDGHEEDDQVGAAHEHLPERGHDGPDVNGQGMVRWPDIALSKIIAFRDDVTILQKHNMTRGCHGLRFTKRDDYF